MRLMRGEDVRRGHGEAEAAEIASDIRSGHDSAIAQTGGSGICRRNPSPTASFRKDRHVAGGRKEGDRGGASWRQFRTAARGRDVVKVLIVYGTTEGQTRKIAEWTATHVRERGHQVELRDSPALASGSDPESFHAFIIAASVHQESHQDTITNFAIAHQKLLNTRPSAFISVSLSAVLEDGRTEAQKYVDRFVSVTGWQPPMTLLLGGALCFSEYDYFQEQIVKFIVMKRSAAAGTERDHEFTDWNALASFVNGFLEAAV
jgi:menaquinone-dependent protoporphyrinogen oxidase